MRLTTRGCSHVAVIGTGQKRPDKCPCGNRYLTAAQLNPKPRKPLARVSEQRAPEARRRRSTLKPGKGFSASTSQRAKVRNRPCVVCGQNSGFDIGEGGGTFTIDAAHVYPRRLQPCECAEGVVPMCRTCHRLADDPDRPFDLLPHLVTRGYHAELAHAVAVHGVPLRELLDQVTGERWVPEREAVAS